MSYNIDKNAHYFILMHPLEGVPFLGLCFTSSSSIEKWVECEVVEDRYKVEDEYKVTLQSIEQGYGREHFYQCDFISLINSGHIIPKTNNNQKCKLVEWGEPLTGNLVLKHSAYIVE